jgi:hypothetical protein
LQKNKIPVVGKKCPKGSKKGKKGEIFQGFRDIFQKKVLIYSEGVLILIIIYHPESI